MLHNELNYLLNNLTIQNIDTTLSQLLLLIKEELYYLQLIEIREKYQDCENNLWKFTKEQQNFQKKEIVTNIHNIINHFLITYPQVSNMSIKSRLKKLVSMGKVEEVIKELLTATENKQNSLHNDLNALRTRYNENESENNRGTVDIDDYRKEQNKIVISLLTYIDKYDENIIVDEENTDKPDKQKTKREDNLKILMLSANHGSRLNINSEYLNIEERLQEKNNPFKFEKRKGISDTEFMEETVKIAPYLLHFSGHGNGSALEMIDEDGNKQFVSSKALKHSFLFFKNVKKIKIQAVILNACYSQEQAEAIAPYVPYVIGTTINIGDKCALAFSQGFYFELADNYSDIETAYHSGVTYACLKDADPEHFVIYKDGKLLS